MYDEGNKGGTTHSANKVNTQVAPQMKGIKQHNDDLEENQYKNADTLQQLTGDATIVGEGCILPTIDTKSMGIAPIEGNTDLPSLMVQTQQINQGLNVLKAAIENLFTRGGGGSGRQRNNPNKNYNNNINPSNTTTTKRGEVTVYRKWDKYGHFC